MCHFSFLMIREYSKLDRLKVESRIAKWINEEVSFEVTWIFYRYHMNNWGEVVLICCSEISCPVIKEVRQDLDIVENELYHPHIAVEEKVIKNGSYFCLVNKFCDCEKKLRIVQI